MRTALVIAAKDIRLRLRDRSALILAFVAPVALAAIIGVAFGQSGGFGFETSWALVDEDGSELSRVFDEQVLGSEGLRDSVAVQRPATPADARDLVERGEVSAAIVIPAGFESDVQAGRDVRLTVIASTDRTIGAGVAEAVTRAFTDQIEASRLSVFTAIQAAPGPPDLERIPELAAAAARQRVPVQLTDTDAGSRDVAGAGYFGPAMAVFFLFFTVGYGARSLLAERRQGTLPRILAAPAPAWSILAGKALAVFVLGLASLATMFVFMSLVFGVDFGDPLAVAALSVATVLAVMAVTAVVQTLARTEQQADAYSQMLAISLALLGGNFFPVFQLPELIQRLSLATPNGWALRGFTDLLYDGGGLAQVAPHLAAVAAFALVAGTIALARSRRMVAA